MSVLTDRITEYLSNGGLWNPESMEHIKVMRLLTDCREGLNALQKQISQEEEENVSLSRVVGERGKEIQALKAQIGELRSPMECGHPKAAWLHANEYSPMAGVGLDGEAIPFEGHCLVCVKLKAQIASARLDEAWLWDNRGYICGEIAHAEGHKRFYPYCRVCARERIAELEKAEKA